MTGRCVRCGGITGGGLVAGMTSHPRGMSPCDCKDVRRAQTYSQRTNDSFSLTAGMRAMTPREMAYRPRRIRSRKSIYRDVYIAGGLVGVLIIGLISVCVRALFF